MDTVIGSRNFTMGESGEKHIRGPRVSEKSTECCRIIKEHGTIELYELAKALGTTRDGIRSVIASATTLAGSMIYEEVDGQHTYFGWLKV